MALIRAVIVSALCLVGMTNAFMVPLRQSAAIATPVRDTTVGPLFAIDITFPGNKKVSGNPGDSLKALAAKAKANINYGCEEGKCGACEAVGSDGKKYRICVAKVPKTDKPLVLK